MSMIRLKTTEGEIYVRRDGIAYVVPQVVENGTRTRLYICLAGVTPGLDIAFHTRSEFEAALAELTK